MGNDGGSIPHRSELVKNKAKPQQKDANNIRRAVWSQCALSKKPLQQPVVLCPLGKLFNKDAILEFLLDRTSYGEGESVCGYVRSMKDTTTLQLTPNPNTQTSSTTDTQTAPSLFVCPLTLKEMNGSLPFVALTTCGCVFSEAALKAVTQSFPSHPPSTASADILPPSPPQSGSDPESSSTSPPSIAAKPRSTSSCPQCSTPFFPSPSPAFVSPPKTAHDLALPSSIISINPPQEIQEAALIELNTQRALLKSLKSSSSSKSTKKRKSTTADSPSSSLPSDATPSSSKKLKDGSVPVVKTAKGVGKVARELEQAEERRRKEFEGMTPAVRSLYAPKGGKKEDEFGNGNYMTRGTFTRYA